LQELYQVTLHKNLYKTVEQLQADFDQWHHHHNTESGGPTGWFKTCGRVEYAKSKKYQTWRVIIAKRWPKMGLPPLTHHQA